MKTISKITSVQKVIKVGSSTGVTIPARDLKASQINVGDEVKITVEAVADVKQIDEEYELFKAQYKKALKNLANR